MRLMVSLVMACVGIAVHTPSVNAGPYFNSSNKDLEELSRAAVKDLSDARIAAIKMLTELDAKHPDEAKKHREEAVRLLHKSLGEFSKIEDLAPNQSIEYSNFNGEQEKRIIAELSDALKRNGKQLPKTEKELAYLAVEYVQDYTATIEKARLDGFPREWQGVRQIIISETQLISIGNLASVVWTISVGS